MLVERKLHCNSYDHLYSILLTVIFKMVESDISQKGGSKVQHDFSPSEQRSFISPERNLQNEDSKVKKKLTFEPEVSLGDVRGNFLVGPKFK